MDKDNKIQIFYKNEIIKGEIQCKIENFVSLPNNYFILNYKNKTIFDQISQDLRSYISSKSLHFFLK